MHALVGFWPSNRKDKKGDKKKSNNSKSSKTEQAQPTQAPDDPSLMNLADEANGLHKMIGSMDGLNELPVSVTKAKCVSVKLRQPVRSLYKPLVPVAYARTLHAIESDDSTRRNQSSGMPEYYSLLFGGHAQVNQFE